MRELSSSAHGQLITPLDNPAIELGRRHMVRLLRAGGAQSVVWRASLAAIALTLLALAWALDRGGAENEPELGPSIVVPEPADAGTSPQLPHRNGADEDRGSERKRKPPRGGTAGEPTASGTVDPHGAPSARPGAESARAVSPPAALSAGDDEDDDDGDEEDD
jgi:hypothetical protein